MWPWYRSLIFWFGAFGVLVILWLWWDSFQFVRSLHTPDRVEPGTSIVSYFSFHSRVGVIGVSHQSIDYSQRSSTKVPDSGFTADSTPLSNPGWTKLREANPSAFPDPLAGFHTTDKEIRTSYFFVAHWFILLVYLGVWSGIFIYRRARLRLACFPPIPVGSQEEGAECSLSQQSAVGHSSQN
jgi:hypothetical protein